MKRKSKIYTCVVTYVYVWYVHTSLIINYNYIEIIILNYKFSSNLSMNFPNNWITFRTIINP